jgi:hypothetical protein
LSSAPGDALGFFAVAVVVPSTVVDSRSRRRGTLIFTLCRLAS